MMYNQPTREELKDIKSIEDPKFKQLMSESPKDKHPYYHAIGTLGGNAVRDKYKK